MMGFVGELGNWVRSCSRKQCRRVFWRVRAAVKKAVKNHHHHRHYGPSRGKSSSSAKRQFRFQYDPCSYALNFDDGIGVAADHLGDIRTEKVKVFPQQYHPISPESSTTTAASIPGSDTTTTWVYVIWLGPFQ